VLPLQHSQDRPSGRGFGWLRGEASGAPESIISGMDADAIIQAIDEEIDRLAKTRALLTGHTAPLKRGLARTTQRVAAQKRRQISAEGRARIAAAQRKRWARAKRG
jgi:hypothetical protein